jgi:CheY-like chemotaxis protein
VAEDNPVNQRVAFGLLTRRGHSVDIVNNGQEALAALAAKTYDVVLMDIQMPVLDGEEATRAIRKREAGTGQHTKIIAMTAHAMKGDRERYLAAGMDAYLTKPINGAEVFAVLEQEDAGALRAPIHDGGRPTTSPLDEIRSQFQDDDLVFDVVTAFLTDCPACVAAIRAAYDARDPVALRTAAHTLKGAAGNVSASALVAYAAQLEQMTQSGTIEPVRAGALVARLEAETEGTLDDLRSSVSGLQRLCS